MAKDRRGGVAEDSPKWKDLIREVMDEVRTEVSYSVQLNFLRKFYNYS